MRANAPAAISGSFMPVGAARPAGRFGLRSPPPVALLDRAIVRLLPAVPKPVVQRLSSRYIAGPSLDDAIRVVRRLNAKGKLATIDVLGEDVTNPDEARAIAGQYHDVLARIDEEGLDSNISIKLTGLGLELEDQLVRENLEAVVQDAAARGNFVRIDMEDSSTTDRTLQLYRALHGEGYDNLGVVLQAYLRRTETDLPGLDNVRLCKGIYVEPESIAFREFEAVRANFIRCLEALVEQGSYVAIATHDEALIQAALRIVQAAGLGPDEYEFQMLLGVRPERADELVADGHRVRVYVPYGTHWYEYSVRRLQENPKMAGYVAADIFKRVRHAVS
jgi:proline dehydrogenase